MVTIVIQFGNGQILIENALHSYVVILYPFVPSQIMYGMREKTIAHLYPQKCIAMLGRHKDDKMPPANIRLRFIDPIPSSI